MTDNEILDCDKAEEIAVEDAVEEARRAILAIVHAYPGHPWRAFDLRAAARNGGDPGALGIALIALLRAGTLAQSPDDHLIRLPT